MDTVLSLSSRYVRYIHPHHQILNTGSFKRQGAGFKRQGVGLKDRGRGLSWSSEVGNFILLLLKDKTCLSLSLLSTGAVVGQKSTNCPEPTGSYLLTSASRDLCSSTSFCPCFSVCVTMATPPIVWAFQLSQHFGRVFLSTVATSATCSWSCPGGQRTLPVPVDKERTDDRDESWTLALMYSR